MKIYFYCEHDGCANSGKAVCLGDSRDYLRITGGINGACAVFGITPGNFSCTSICLGDFDGVHLGHRALFDAAKRHGEWGVLLFDRNTKNSPLLTTVREKIKIIEDFGADYVVLTEFTEEFSHKSPGEFVSFLKNGLGVERAVAGYDYRFGFRAEGDAELLEALCGEKGIKTELITAVKSEGEPIKSTQIRNYINKGNISGANELLGYAYIVSGAVVKGFGNGRKMGFPTANIAYEPEKLLPPDGVYSGRVHGRAAVINIGKNPTFDAELRTLEAHILDYDGDLYGTEIAVEFYEKIRDDIKFDSPEGLIKQIESDIKKVRERTGLWQREL